jgi:hypothetical protein
LFNRKTETSILKKIILLFLIPMLGFSGIINGQEWKFIKEKDGIKIYTRNEENNPVKSFKGETVLNTNMEKIKQIIGRVESFEWWADDIKEIKVLEYIEEEVIKYYLIYDVPWPLADRDLCVESKITNDPVTGTRVVFATPLPGIIPINPDMVRITNYWQKWTMTPAGDNQVSVVLEGSVDPAGAIPAWIVNMVITDTPLSIIGKVRELVE